MDDQRKDAYRYLLYHAMLDIRSITWLRFTNPFRWASDIRRAKRAGAVADCLHNLALFSALDFEHFDEDRFWRDARSLKERYPDFELAHYHEVFERELLVSQNA